MATSIRNIQFKRVLDWPIPINPMEDSYPTDNIHIFDLRGACFQWKTSPKKLLNLFNAIYGDEPSSQEAEQPTTHDGDLEFWPAYNERDRESRLFVWPEKANCPRNVFTLRTETLKEGDGPLICTVIMNPAFTDETVERFRWLLSMAPDLWQSLYNLAVAVADIDMSPEVKDAFDVLWQSSTTNPLAIDDWGARYRIENERSMASLRTDEPPAVTESGTVIQ